LYFSSWIPDKHDATAPDKLIIAFYSEVRQLQESYIIILHHEFVYSKEKLHYLSGSVHGHMILEEE